MLKFNKKTYIYHFFGLTLMFSVLFLFNISQANALSPDINQVKVPGESTVYYLNHATSQRKAYINEAVFFGLWQRLVGGKNYQPGRIG